MSESYETVVVKRLQGMTLSKVIWQRFRQDMSAYQVAERTLDHNPGLAAMGPIMPFGTTFDLVIPGPEEQSPQVPVIRLYGASE